MFSFSSGPSRSSSSSSYKKNWFCFLARVPPRRSCTQNDLWSTWIRRQSTRGMSPPPHIAIIRKNYTLRMRFLFFHFFIGFSPSPLSHHLLSALPFPIPLDAVLLFAVSCCNMNDLKLQLHAWGTAVLYTYYDGHDVIWKTIRVLIKISASSAVVGCSVTVHRSTTSPGRTAGISMIWKFAKMPRG